MARWEIATHAELCGFAGCPIQAGDPVHVLTGTRTRRVRCRAHAIGPVDEAAIERAAMEAVEGQLERELATARAAARAYEQVFGRQTVFDFKTAAAGKDE